MFTPPHPFHSPPVALVGECSMPLLGGTHLRGFRVRDMGRRHREQIVSSVPAITPFGVLAIKVFDQNEADGGQILGEHGWVKPGEPRLPRRCKSPLDSSNIGRAFTTKL